MLFRSRMLIQKAIDLDLSISVLDPDPDAPCRHLVEQFQCGSFNDFNTVYSFGKDLDLITIEIEHVNVEALEKLEKEGVLVYREDFEAAQAAVLTNLILEASSLSRRIRTDIPHLTQEDVDKIQARIDDVFNKVSTMTFEELDT